VNRDEYKPRQDASKDEPKEALRYNQGKIDLTQLSPLAQIMESLVFQYGECKYDRGNWKKFKEDEQKQVLEYLQCYNRHMMRYNLGEFFDKESKLPHLAHAVWNLNRIMDLFYYGVTHGKDGKDLFHQELRHPLPPIPCEANFKEIWGFEYQPHKKKNKNN